MPKDPKFNSKMNPELGDKQKQTKKRYWEFLKNSWLASKPKEFHKIRNQTESLAQTRESSRILKEFCRIVENRKFELERRIRDR